MKKLLLASYLGACISSPQVNADAPYIYFLDDIVVTASRFTETNPALPSNIEVITRNDIQASPALNLPDLLKTRAGINVISLYGQMAMNASVDMRGFGDTASSNTVILLDGQRLNPIDSGSINWSAIPLKSVERVEIIRGSGSVLYGDRASGGVINIITDTSAKSVTNAELTLGSHGLRAADVQVAGGAGNAYFNIAGHLADTDGWRRNTQAEQTSLAGRAGYRGHDGNVFLDFSAYRDASGTPSSLFRNQYLSQPDMARYPFDHQKRQGQRARPGFSMALSKDLELEAEVGYLDDRYRGYNFTAGGAPSYRSDRAGETWSATPRLRWRHSLGGLSSSTVFGLDWYDGRITSDTWSSFSGTNTQQASQVSQAVYMQNTTALTPALDVTLGARGQRVRQSAADIGAGLDSSARRTRNAWEAGLSYRPNDIARVYAKVGRTFRFPNTDELFGFDPTPPFATIFRGDLRPQQGTVRETGAAWKTATASLRAAIYQTDLTDEIGYDGNIYANVNLPATRHQGLEMEGSWRISPAWQAHLAYTRNDATFREGTNSGNTIPSVPRDRATLRISWHGGKAGTWSALANYTGRQRYSGDVANNLDTYSGHTSVDLRADWDLKPWQLAVRLTNLFDRRYASAVGYSSLYSDYYYYPADPRSLFITASYDFR